MGQERKLVTILFADIVGSTALGLEHDPEVIRAALRRTFDALRDVLVGHGGTVEKFIGDAVMAVFGVPVAHDDDADRAVRSAFALRSRVAELNQTARTSAAGSGRSYQPHGTPRNWRRGKRLPTSAAGSAIPSRTLPKKV